MILHLSCICPARRPASVKARFNSQIWNSGKAVLDLLKSSENFWVNWIYSAHAMNSITFSVCKGWISWTHFILGRTPAVNLSNIFIYFPLRSLKDFTARDSPRVTVTLFDLTESTGPVTMSGGRMLLYFAHLDLQGLAVKETKTDPETAGFPDRLMFNIV